MHIYDISWGFFYCYHRQSSHLPLIYLFLSVSVSYIFVDFNVIILPLTKKPSLQFLEALLLKVIEINFKALNFKKSSEIIFKDINTHTTNTPCKCSL